MTPHAFPEKDEANPDTDDCDHPLPDREIYGNPDPYNQGAYPGVPDWIQMDARCELCGEKVAVHYRIDPAKSGVTQG